MDTTIVVLVKQAVGRQHPSRRWLSHSDVAEPGALDGGLGAEAGDACASARVDQRLPVTGRRPLHPPSPSAPLPPRRPGRSDGSYQAVRVMHDMQELTNREIAAVLGCSLATAEIRHRGSAPRVFAQSFEGVEGFQVRQRDVYAQP